ncbi:aconitate hydratase, cytoplasmic [Tanacetum coccineum]
MKDEAAKRAPEVKEAEVEGLKRMWKMMKRKMAMGRRGEQYPIFKLYGVKNFGAGLKELGFGENYTSLTRHLGDSIYSLNFLEFTQAVETLIDDMSVNADDLDGLTTYKWRRRMFIVVTAVAEAARSKVVSLSYDQSRERGAPTSTSWMWIKLLFKNWEKISKAAIGVDENIGLGDLTKEETDMLFARNMPHTEKDLKKNLKAVLARGKICRAGLNILCGGISR